MRTEDAEGVYCWVSSSGRDGLQYQKVGLCRLDAWKLKLDDFSGELRNEKMGLEGGRDMCFCYMRRNVVERDDKGREIM
jgi:hypothetical protein